MKILAINGSYRENGMTDQAIEVITNYLKSVHHDIEIINLRDHPIEFCQNCRACTQVEGDTPGTCALDDEMYKLIEKIESADAYILASPTNFNTVTALFKRFQERLLPYAYWPWGTPIPQFRKAEQMHKKAIVLSSCAAPTLLGRFFFDSIKLLKMTAKTIGAKTKGSLLLGYISKEQKRDFTKKEIDKLESLAKSLL